MSHTSYGMIEVYDTLYLVEQWLDYGAQGIGKQLGGIDYHAVGVCPTKRSAERNLRIEGGLGGMRVVESRLLVAKRRFMM